MGNIFKALGSAGPQDLDLTNGGTDVFFDVLTLAGCAIAETPWERNLVLRFADGQRWGRGFDGFDLGDLPWTDDWPAEKAFLERVIALASDRHGWDRLPDDPPFAARYLARYREMVAGYTPSPVPEPRWGDWRVPPADELTVRCPIHDLYTGEAGCRLCDTSLQPLPDPG